MMQHTELDLLSAYVDGELDDAERARVKSHLPTCAECRGTLDALLLTLADLKTLPDEAPAEQDSWALRAAIARARKPAGRWQRYVVAAGSVAAVAIAFVAFMNVGGRQASKNSTAAGALGLVTVNENFDKFSAQTHLLVLAGKVPSPEAVTAAPDLDTAGASGNRDGTFAPTSKVQGFAALSDASSGDLDRCVEVVRSSTQNYLKPFRYELARFEDRPAFFLVFQTEDRYELWVMSADPKKPCETLFFSQTS